MKTNGITLICLPAMGVRASYYNLFAAMLGDQGFNVVTADWRGHGKSSIRPSRSIDFGYEELIGDVKELVGHVDRWFPDSKKVIIGHSLGGQVGSLFASRFEREISALILITSCSVFYKGWDGWDRVRVRFAAGAFHRLSMIIGYFPGGLIGFGGKEARTVIKDWCYNARYGEYCLSNSTHDYEESLKKLETIVLTISIDQDRLATRRAVENLYKKFSKSSSILHVHLKENETNIKRLNHFNWAKYPDHFVDVIKRWVDGNIIIS